MPYMSTDKHIGDYYDLNDKIRFYHLENRLVVNEENFRLEDKVSQVLQLLIAQRGKVVSRDQILSQVWADVMVTDDVINQSIYKLRKYFKKGLKKDVLITTIPKKGYKLEAEVLQKEEVGNKKLDTSTRLKYRISVHNFKKVTMWSTAVVAVLVLGVMWQNVGDPEPLKSKRYKAVVEKPGANTSEALPVSQKVSITITRDQLNDEGEINMDKLKELARTLSGDSLGSEIRIYEEKDGKPVERE